MYLSILCGLLINMLNADLELNDQTNIDWKKQPMPISYLHLLINNTYYMNASLNWGEPNIFQYPKIWHANELKCSNLILATRLQPPAKFMDPRRKPQDVNEDNAILLKNWTQRQISRLKMEPSNSNLAPIRDKKRHAGLMRGELRKTENDGCNKLVYIETLLLVKRRTHHKQIDRLHFDILKKFSSQY